MMDVGIEAEHLSLAVPTYLQRDRANSNWRGVFFGAMFDPPRRQVVPLLKDFNFTIGDGERMALLGQNGAGKSTLLKVLNGAYAPTSGRLMVRGRAQSLINLSLGFHNHATVRENVFLRGTAMGLDSSYIRKHLDDILNFADIPEKVNQRLFTLSSGQKMRLGFAISTSIQQDILLLDEWMSTGDANFRVKAKERLQDRVESSKIVVFASHDAGMLRDICTHGMVIDHGRLLYIGDIEPAIEFYQEVLALQWASGSTQELDFSGDRARVYGYVDDAVLESPGKLRLKGWMASTREPRPEKVALRLGDKTPPAQNIRRFERKDVAKRFGVRDPEPGFYATFDLPGVATLDSLGDMVVLGGQPGQEAETVLRQSDKLVVALRTGGEG
jgi:ABC-type polysaccharide/polyol phosphate transport system ATPase subunit